MSRVFLENADLSGADLSHADLNRAALSQADLSGAVLFYADLSDAGLVGANLAEANLYGADISKITGWQSIKSIRYANIYGVKSPPNGFEEWAEKHGAVSIENQQEWINLIRKEKQEQTKEKTGDKR